MFRANRRGFLADSPFQLFTVTVKDNLRFTKPCVALMKNTIPSLWVGNPSVRAPAIIQLHGHFTIKATDQLDMLERKRLYCLYFVKYIWHVFWYI